jgi:hypothetical protein
MSGHSWHYSGWCQALHSTIHLSGFSALRSTAGGYQLAIDRVSSTTYDGLLQIDADRLQLDARRFGELVVGILRSHRVELRFGTQLEGNALILQTEDGRRVVLLRTGRQ